MKKIFTFFTVLACTMAVFTACAGDEHVIEPPLPAAAEIEGELTYATFSFRPDGVEAGTRAPMQTDTNEPDPSNLSFNSIRMLVFGLVAGQCEVDTLIIFSNPAQLNGSLQLATIPVTSGQKRVLVIANTAGKAKLTSLLPRMTGIRYEAFLSDYNLYDIGTPAVSTGLPPETLDFSELIQTGDPASSMVYSNSINESDFIVQPGVTAPDSQDPTDPNHFEITLKRPVAKITLTTSLTSPILVASGEGWVQDLKYRIWSVNRSLYLFQNFNASNALVIPYGNMSPSDFALYYYRGKYDYADLLPASSPAAAVYVTENVPETAYGGNTTYAEVQAVFVPKPEYVIAGFSWDNGTFKDITHPYEVIPGSDFYTVDFNGTHYLFVDSGKAYKAAYCIKYGTEPPPGFIGNLYNKLIELGVDIYKGGKTYFRFNFGEQAGGAGSSINYGIKRNHHYVANISSFMGLGLFRPEEEQVPIQGNTNITVSVTVEPWIIDYINF